ncbi:MAG: acetyl-CoA C-acetyltransferase [Deltaproteobacteria bacterium]|nr:MAG: acetyl-CoA C-acetyltransferase [Deltaproteobacteria bacterium]
MKEVQIVSAARTAVGSFQGGLSSLPATKLGSVVIEEVVKRAGIKKNDIDQVIMGNVLSAGLGQAPARQAALGAGLPDAVNCLTINKVCGSGLKSVMLAAQAIMVDDAGVIVAGGMESMTNSPYQLPKARSGYRMGDGEIIDSMINDGLWDPYDDCHMGNFAEVCGEKYKITRERQDEFSLESYRRAQEAQKEGRFREEIVPVEIPGKKGEPIIFDADEDPGKLKAEKVPTLKPAFKKDGTVTAANASSISDGAAAVLVMSSDEAKSLGCKPLVRVSGYAEASIDPKWFTIAPVEAVKRVLEKTKMKKDDIDLFEINEAFSVVTIRAIDEFSLDPAKVNVNGGAVSIGHPIGGSGARILVTLLYAMKDRKAKTGMATLCIGGGEAVAMVVERMGE